VGVCLCNCRKEVQIPCGQRRSGVNNTPDGRTVTEAKSRSQLQGDMWECSLDGDRKDATRRQCHAEHGAGKLSMKIWGLLTFAVLVATKDAILFVKAPSVADMARMVLGYFF
jgi:hypothetical protein